MEKVEPFGRIFCGRHDAFWTETLKNQLLSAALVAPVFNLPQFGKNIFFRKICYSLQLSFQISMLRKPQATAAGGRTCPGEFWPDIDLVWPETKLVFHELLNQQTCAVLQPLHSTSGHPHSSCPLSRSFTLFLPPCGFPPSCQSTTAKKFQEEESLSLRFGRCGSGSKPTSGTVHPLLTKSLSGSERWARPDFASKSPGRSGDPVTSRRGSWPGSAAPWRARTNRLLPD